MDWYSQTDSNGTVTYHWNKNLNSDNASDILTDGQAYIGVNRFVNGTNGYEFLGSSANSRFTAWKDSWGFSYYQDNTGMTNMYVTGEMVLDNAKLALFASVGQGFNWVKGQTANGLIKLFQPGAYLNRGKYIRFGFGHHKGKWVFRFGGKLIEKLGFKNGKFDLIKTNISKNIKLQDWLWK